MARATLKQVAERAEVSSKTVSNVINGTATVSPATRERVEAALAELDYVPNLTARGLRNGRTGVIVLALPDLATPYSAEMAHAFVEAAHEFDWSVQIEETGSRPEREVALLSRARARMVDGLILNPTMTDEFALPQDRARIPPTVLIGEVEEPLLDRVCVDPNAAAYEMTAYLASRGDRRIAVVGSPKRTSASTPIRRTRGYEHALRDAGITPEASLKISCDEWTAQDGAAAVCAFLDVNPLPDAFFCFTDTLAIGTLSELWRRGIHVPEDVRVAGFDNLAHGEFAAPPLTTIAFDKPAFAREALHLLRRRIDSPGAEVQVSTIEHYLIERASTLGR